MNPSWFYNEFHQVGTDFENPAVAAYDCNQRSSTVEAEQALIAKLGIKAGDTIIDLGCGTQEHLQFKLPWQGQLCMQ